MSKLKKRLMLVLTGMIMFSFLLATALVSGNENKLTSLTVNSSKVAFAGHEWWVIGDETSGVYSQNNHITLLSKTHDFGDSAFRTGSHDIFPNSTYVTFEGLSWYYANNPSNLEAWTLPTEYAGSTLQQKMVSLAENMPIEEQAFISARNFSGGGTWQNPIEGIIGQGINGQTLWALSEEEWRTIDNSTVRSYDDFWWLRSYRIMAGNPSGSDLDSRNPACMIYATRPALSLNISSILFTSVVAEDSTSARVGSNLAGVTAPTSTDTVKFTMLNNSQKVTINPTTSQTSHQLSFTYSNTTTGANQLISCALTDSEGNVKYYGNLADCSTGASGTLSVPLDGVADGNYTLNIFSEEVNGHLYSNFCSEPFTMRISVAGGTLHEHNWTDEWSHNDSHHWHECMAADCSITDDSQKNGYATHSFDKQNVLDTYIKNPANCDSPAVYYKSCECGDFSTSADTFISGKGIGHSWDVPIWNWSMDHTAAAIQLTCINDRNHRVHLQSTISSQTTAATCTKMGQTIYTASVNYEGITYSDSKTVPISATGHTPQHIQAKEPTVTSAGNIEYWYCAKCDTYFSDEELTNEIQKQDTIRSALTAVKKPLIITVQTSDTIHILVWGTLMLLSVSTVIIVVKKKYNK